MTNSLSEWILLAATTAALAACTSSDAQHTGTLELPVTAVGASGATYHLPPHTFFNVSTADDVNASRSFEFDDSVPQLSIELAAGAYDTGLFNAAGYTTIWPLTRVSTSGQTTTVQGILQPMPSVQIVDGQTTEIAVQFVVQGEAPISFGHGSLGVGVTVTETGATVHEITITTSGLLIQSGTPTTDAPAELAARLPAEGTAGVQLTATARTIAGWTAATSSQVCTFVHLTLTGSPEIADLLAEFSQNLDPRSNLLCIVTSSGSSQVFIDFGNQGPAQTPLLADLGAPSYLDIGLVSAFVPTEVVKDFTLNLAALEQTPATSIETLMDLWALPDATTSSLWLEQRMIAFDRTTVTATPIFEN